jgi:predicted nucleic acid-binding protein
MSWEQFLDLPDDDRAEYVDGKTVVTAGRQHRVRVMDLLIAATAKAHGVRLYTRNPGDLQGLEELVDVVPV